MDRKAILLYLQNVRDLEVADYYLEKQYDHANTVHLDRVLKKMNSHKNLLSIPEFKWKQVGFGFVMCVLGLITITVGTIIGIQLIIEDEHYLPILWQPLLCYPILGWIAHYLYPGSKKKQEEEYNKQVREIEKQNAYINAYNAKVDQEIENENKSWDEKSKWYVGEINKVRTIKFDFYNMDIIPVQYRGLSPAVFLYDYMSTSQESFQMALLSNQIEDGIRRITEKLNDITNLLREQIYETRCLREESRQRHEQIISQNEQMIQSLASIEESAEEASHYADLAANYSKANAFFSLATYLGKKRNN